VLASFLTPLATASQLLARGVVVCATATSIGEVSKRNAPTTGALANSRVAIATLVTLKPALLAACNALAIVLKCEGLKRRFVHDSILVAIEMVAFEHECASNEHFKLSRFDDLHGYSLIGGYTL
jgi:hypothetical protein